MLQLQKNRGGHIECNRCNKEIEYYDEYYWNTETGEIICEKCKNNKGGVK